MSTINNLSVITDKFGKDYIKREGSPELQYNCPFCQKRRGKPDNDHKLYVNMNSLKFICFKCGAKGRLGKKIQKSIEGLYSSLSNYFRNKETECDSEDDESSDNMFYIPNVKIKHGSVAYEYLRKRGITDDLMEYYDFRLGIDDMFGRIIVPNDIFGQEGIWTDMFSARSYINQVPKYEYPQGAKKSRVVFNLHRTRKGDCVRVVEGVITAVCGGKNALCIYGSHPSDNQLAQISDMEYEEVDCVLDNDPAGRPGNLLLADELSKRKQCGKVFIVTMPEGIDAADMGELEFDKYVKANRVPYYSNVYAKILMFAKERLEDVER